MHDPPQRCSSACTIRRNGCTSGHAGDAGGRRVGSSPSPSPRKHRYHKCVSKCHEFSCTCPHARTLLPLQTPRSHHTPDTTTLSKPPARMCDCECALRAAGTYRLGLVLVLVLELRGLVCGVSLFSKRR